MLPSCVETHCLIFILSLMATIIVLAVLTLLFGLLEIFILPGFGIAGFAAIACAVADAVFIYTAYGPLWTFVAVVIAVVLLIVSLYYVAHSRSVDRLSLKAAIKSTNATTDQLSVKVGDKGRSLTRLALVGNAMIEGRQVEVKSSGEFLDAGTPIRVVSVNEAQIVVEKDI